jgi:fimbrial chaperone protein
MFFFVGAVHADGWRVIPIRLDFDQKTRSGVITLTNDSEQIISFNVEAMEWTQDGQGQDHYLPTNDLVFFPKVLSINPKQERVIRAGLKVPPVNQEKTYRLFIKEVPKKRETVGTNVSIAVRFGVPVFAAPPRKDMRGEIAETLLDQGKLIFTTNNTGNVHFRIETTYVSGKNDTGEVIFSNDLMGWYLLVGAGRTFSLEIPNGICRQLKVINILASSDDVQFSGTIDVVPSMCSAN